jgi:hypothetical protein
VSRPKKTGDSLPISEAPFVPAPPEPEPVRNFFPDWSYCEAHKTWFVFECARCSPWAILPSIGARA